MPYKLNLQLFADEAAGADNSSEGAAAAIAGNPDVNGVATGNTGEQAAPAAGDQTGEDSWESLINGKFKKEYGKAVKDAVQKRMRNQRDLQSQVDRMNPLVAALANKYGIQAAQDGSYDLDALNNAVQNDNSLFEQEAFERGMSVEELKHVKALERENAQLRNQSQQAQRQRDWDEITQESEALKQIYPDFDLEEEMMNPMFGRVLATMRNSGFPNSVQTAFEAVHREEIMGGAMQYAVQRTASQISKSIQAGQKRPVENGNNGQATASVGGIDPSKLTREQIHEMAMRADRGEHISF